jgi:hypothetical protein
MGVEMFDLVFGWIVSWFSKPKKPLVATPVIRPALGDGKQVLYEVVEDFAIYGFIVKKGTKTDGASIPLFLCSILGAHPFSPAIVAQCIAHDVKYAQAIKIFKDAAKTKNKALKKAAMEELKRADNWFYDALRINTRRLRCKLFFLAVRIYSALNFGVWQRYIKPVFNKLFNKEKK